MAFIPRPKYRDSLVGRPPGFPRIGSYQRGTNFPDWKVISPSTPAVRASIPLEGIKAPLGPVGRKFQVDDVDLVIEFF
jgi:hypothetical protein